eukprot:scaffold118097_cov19-Tisochrysis_lutea.AAC.2
MPNIQASQDSRLEEWGCSSGCIAAQPSHSKPLLSALSPLPFSDAPAPEPLAPHPSSHAAESAGGAPPYTATLPESLSGEVPPHCTVSAASSCVPHNSQAASAAAVSP